MTDQTDQPQNDGDLQGLIHIPIELTIPDDMKSTFTNHVIVQHSNDEFFLYFFEVNPPLSHTWEGLSEEEVREKIEAENLLAKGNCVSRIVLSSSLMESVIKAMGENYEKYLRKKSDASENEEEEVD